MVSLVCRRRIIGASTSCADSSKKLMMVLSWVMNIDTCSQATASFLLLRDECFSMNTVRGSFGAAWYLCSVRSSFGSGRSENPVG